MNTGIPWNTIGAVIVWLLASVILVPDVANKKGMKSVSWAIASLVMSPLLVLIALAAIPHERREEPKAKPEWMP